MKQIELKQYYPAGGKVPAPVKISDVKATTNPNVFKGKAQLPLTDAEQKVLIYRLELESGAIDYRVISAYCPHQGYDLTKDPVKSDGNVHCGWHKRPICIYSEYNQAFPVIIKNIGQAEEYWIQAS